MLDVITAGQATGIRFDIPWIHAQPAATTFNWGFVDTAVNAAYNRGLFILGTITTCPGWAAGTNNGDAYNRPRSAADYANFCPRSPPGTTARSMPTRSGTSRTGACSLAPTPIRRSTLPW